MIKQIVRVIKIMWKYARRETIFNFAQVLLISMMTPLSLLFTQNLINSFVLYFNSKSGIYSIVLWTLLLLVGMFLVSGTGFFDGIQKIAMKRRLDKEFTQHVINKFRKIEYSCFENAKTQDTLERMGNSPQDLILNIFQNLMGALSRFISLIGIILIFAQVSWLLSAVFFIMIPLMVWLDSKSMAIMNEMFNNQSQDERYLSYYARLLSEKNSLLELKVFSAVDYIFNAWKAKNKKVLRERLTTTIKAQKYFALSSVIVLIWIGIVIYSMIRGIRLSTVSLGLFVSLVGSSGGLLGMSEQLSYIVSNLTRHYLQVRHYETFINLPEVQTCTSYKPTPRGIQEIEFDNVCFQYPNTEKEILKGVSFKIKSNERLSIVGENGAGKSTIIKLLCRLYRPTAGNIRINGIDLDEFCEKQLHDILCVVFQDYCCYNLTLRESVALSQIDKIEHDVKIKHALQKAKADMISDNLDIALGKIEDEGIDISGGQWQRLALARAMFSDSAFIILDEPTASLDPLAESEMYLSFANVLSDKGCIMISHRLASAKMADKIIVIHDGLVCESGKHEELLAGKRLYSRMWEAQSSWYAEDSDNEKTC